MNNCELVIVTGNTSALEGFVGQRYIPSSDSSHFSLINPSDLTETSCIREQQKCTRYKSEKGQIRFSLSQHHPGGSVLLLKKATCDFYFYSFFTQYLLNISNVREPRL